MEEHEVRLGVARSKMDTQALLSMAQHGSAWLSMAQHAAVSVLFRCTWDLVCVFSSEKKEKKQGFDEQPLNIDRTKDNIR